MAVRVRSIALVSNADTGAHARIHSLSLVSDQDTSTPSTAKTNVYSVALISNLPTPITDTPGAGFLTWYENIEEVQYVARSFQIWPDGTTLEIPTGWDNYVPPAPPTTPELIWSEEFTNTLNLASATNTTGRWRANDVNLPLTAGHVDAKSGSTWNLNPAQVIDGAPRSPFTVSNGELAITTQRTPESWLSGIASVNGGVSLPWVGGLLVTNTARPENQFGYGYYAIRAKLPVPGQGVFPSIRLYAANGLNPGKERAEIDIFEMFGYGGGQPWNVSLHQKKADGTAATGATTPSGLVSVTTQATETTGWHIYALDWTSTYLRFYRDNVLVAQVTGAAATFFNNVKMGMRFGAVVNSPTFGASQTAIPETPSPMTFNIDWIRVWDKEPNPLPIIEQPVAQTESGFGTVYAPEYRPL